VVQWVRVAHGEQLLVDSEGLHHGINSHGKRHGAWAESFPMA
jgi:hypothetical protein